MNNTAEWGRDPSVQIMRKVFKAMENAQVKLLWELDIQPYDLRIRGWREKALALFERAWVSASRIGLNMDERSASAMYVYGLAKVMHQDGIEVPSELLPPGEEVKRIFRELGVEI